MSVWRLSAWYFIYFAFIGVYMPYFGVYLQSRNFSAWEISILLSLMQVMRLAAPNLWGWLADLLGRKKPVIHGTVLLCSLSFSALFLVDGFHATFAVIALACFFWSASLPLVETLTLNQLQQHPERYGRIRLWGSVGFVVAVQGIGALLDVQPIHSLLWIALSLLILLFASSLSLPEMLAAQHSRARTSIRAMLRRPQLQPLLWAAFLTAAAHGPLYIFYSIHLVDHHYSKTVIGALWSLGVLAEILAFMLMPHLLRRHSLRHLLLVIFAATALRFLLIGWGADMLLVQVLAQLLHGISFGAFHAVMVAILHQWFPGREQVHAQALYGSISFGAGGLLGSLLSGLGWELLGAGWVYSLSSLFALLGLLIVWRYIREQAADNGTEQATSHSA